MTLPNAHIHTKIIICLQRVVWELVCDWKEYNSSMCSIKGEGVRYNYQELVGLVNEWNVQFRLREKYHTWRLKYSLPKVPPAFSRLVEHSIVSYVMGNLGWLVQASPEKSDAELGKMKQAYSEMNLGSSISSDIFNFWMVLLVKLAAYFLSNHVAAVLVDSALECDIYRHTMLNILGIHIEKNTYCILLRMFASKRQPSKDRKSINLPQGEKGKSQKVREEKENDPRLKTVKSIGRRNGKHETHFFNSTNQDRSRIQEIKYLLKSNLYVKPIPRKVEPKFSIEELKQQGKQYSSLQNHARVTPKGKFTIQANQLSQAFSCNYAFKLNQVKNHSIHCSHTKHIVRPRPQQLIKKLQIKREEERTVEPRRPKPPKNWTKLVTEMKEDLYQGKGGRECQEEGSDARRREKDYYMEVQIQKEVQQQKQRKEGQPSEEVFRFRKLDLMNSPNIIVYEDCPMDLNDEQPHNDQTIRMNRSRLQKTQKRRNHE